MASHEARCDFTNSLSSSGIIVCCLLAVLALLSLVATLVAWWPWLSVNFPRLYFASSDSSRASYGLHAVSHSTNHNAASDDSRESDALLPTNGKHASPDTATAPATTTATAAVLPKPRGALMRAVHCFDLVSNWRQLTAPSPVGPGLRTLDGMRVLSMCWVVLGHTLLWMVQANLDNVIYVGRTMESSFMPQLLFNGLFSVDTFFFLSGFLATFLLFKAFLSRPESAPGSPGRSLFFTLKIYAARYLRLTPLYGAVLLIYYYILPAITRGPFVDFVTSTTSDYQVCSKYWWTNILYLNNILPASEQFGANPTEGGLGCMGWSWYLANDFQFHLLMVPLALVLYRHRGLGLGLLVFLAVACTTVTGVLIHHYNIQQCSFILQPPKHEGDSQTIIYNKPWTRINPYILGMLLGWIFAQVKADAAQVPALRALLRRKPSYAVRLSVLLGALAIMLACVFGTYGDSHTSGVDQGECVWSRAQNDAYLTLMRLAWSVALFLLVGLCLLGWAPLVTGILSARLFTAWSRLVFATYLIHPIIMDIVYFTRNHPMDYTDATFICNFLGIAAMAFLTAVPLHLFIEAPTRNLTKMLIGGR